MAMLAVQGLQDGKRVFYAGPTADQTDRFWYAVRSYLDNDIQAGRLYKSETKRIIEEFNVDENAPRIKCKTAHDADTLRGDWGNLIMLDEYSLMNTDVDTVVLPMLLDKGGVIIYGGTPKRRNHFYHKYMLAKNDDTRRWGYWHFTSHDNPYLNVEALAEISQDLTEEGYRQEILAEFLESDGSVFHNILACINAPFNDPIGKHRQHTVVMGLDWGQSVDFTAASVVCKECAIELELERFNRISYNYQRERIKSLAEKWHVQRILAEENSIGKPNIDALQADGLPVIGFMTTATSKPPLIESLALAFERAEVQWLDIQVATGELEAYERKVSATTGRSQYSAPEGLHDDTVIARALANKARLDGGTFARAYVF